MGRLGDFCLVLLVGAEFFFIAWSFFRLYGIIFSSCVVQGVWVESGVFILFIVFFQYGLQLSWRRLRMFFLMVFSSNSFFRVVIFIVSDVIFLLLIEILRVSVSCGYQVVGFLQGLGCFFWGLQFEVNQRFMRYGFEFQVFVEGFFINIQVIQL